MPLEHRFICPLVNGLHARPATQLSQVAARYAAQVSLRNQRNDAVADCKSVLDLVAASVMQGDACTLEIGGDDATAAHAALVEFIEHVLPGCDEPLPEAAACKHSGALPRLLRDSDLSWVSGSGVSLGIGIGRIVHVGSKLYTVNGGKEGAGLAVEAGRLERALAAVEVDLTAQLGRNSGASRGLLEATLAMLRDPHLAQAMHAVLAGDSTAELAVMEATADFQGRLAQSESAYLRERIADISDIGMRLISKLDPSAIESGLPAPLDEPSIVCAETLSPAQLLELDRSLLRGLVLSSTGAASHTVILARSFGIPTLCGVANMAQLRQGDLAVVDADRGMAIAPLTSEGERFYAWELEAQGRRQRRLMEGAPGPAQTADGKRVAVAANVSSADEATAAHAVGAEGIGLFRTEMLYTEQPEPPSEDEQYAAYRRAVEATPGQPVVIRTFDVGGDKPLPYLRRAPEDNPFLGYRGIRVYAGHHELLEQQLRAICCASAHGPVWLMAPMVSSVDEMRWFRQQIEAVQTGLADEGIAFDPHMPIGAMVEVPAAAFAIHELAEMCDFFSIGSNDLSQYFFAADRGNPAVARLNSERHPAFLRLLKHIVDEARQAGRWVGLCGEMAGDPRNLPLLVGLGLDELSMSAPRIAAAKSGLARLDTAACVALLDNALACGRAEEVDGLLAEFSASALAMPLIEPDLMRLGSTVPSKAHALHELALLAYAAERTDDSDALEDALWAREGTYATSVGHGFAIPHCKNAAVKAATLAVLRLAAPVQWAESEPTVDFLIMLAMPAEAAREHLQVFARLARKLMDEGFREQLRAMADPGAMSQYLIAELN